MLPLVLKSAAGVLSFVWCGVFVAVVLVMIISGVSFLKLHLWAMKVLVVLSCFGLLPACIFISSPFVGDTLRMLRLGEGWCYPESDLPVILFLSLLLASPVLFIVTLVMLLRKPMRKAFGEDVTSADDSPHDGHKADDGE